MFHIHADDLTELEKTVPELADALFTMMTPAIATKIRRVQLILMHVRWKYGPPSHVEKISDEDIEIDT